MIKRFIFILILFIYSRNLTSQNFEVDTLQYKGNIDNYINIVFLGDGYTITDQDKFIIDCKTITADLFKETPFKEYSNYFNVFAIKVISNESGIKHQNNLSDCSGFFLPILNPDNYFSSSLDNYNIHRLIIARNDVKLGAALAVNFPKFDQICIIVNTSIYGGSGGAGLLTLSSSGSMGEVFLHEMGHAIGNLGDEYFAGDNYFTERPNMTTESNPAKIKWKNWLPGGSVGIFKYCCSNTSSRWYKPSENCIMQDLGQPFCSVCREGIIEYIHLLTNPIVKYSPDTYDVKDKDRFIDFKLLELMRPKPNTLKINWEYNGASIAKDVDSIKFDQEKLIAGNNYISVVVEDQSSLQKIDNHIKIHYNYINWNIVRTYTGVKITNSENNIDFSIFPNPTNDNLNISLQLDKKSKVSIHLFDVQGKLIHNILKDSYVESNFLDTIKLDKLPSGIYYIQITVDNFIRTHKFIKK